MRGCDNPIECLASCMADAIYEGFPLIDYEERDFEATKNWSITKIKEAMKNQTLPMIKNSHRHTRSDVCVIAMFPQTWGSTALGFGGLGGQAITTAYTVIIRSEHDRSCCVYFGARFAYRIKKPNKLFYEDLKKDYMLPVAEQNKYEQVD